MFRSGSSRAKPAPGRLKCESKRAIRSEVDREIGRPLAEPDESSYDRLQYGVYRTFITVTGVFSALMVVVEIWARGPLAPQTWAFVGLSLMFGVLIYRTRLTRDTKVGTVIAIGVFMTALGGFEFVLGNISPIGIRAAILSAPVITVLLAEFRPALVFFLWGILHTIVGTPTDSGFTVHVLQSAGAIFVGGVLLAMAWRFDRARRNAERLAEEREHALSKALQEAQAAVSARTQFLSNMSHEIRTPMNGVLGLSRLLVEESTSSNRELAETVVSSAESLLRVLDDILDLSKLDAGALLIEPKTVRPADIARQVNALMKANANEAGLELFLEVSPNVPEWVEMDGHRFRQVLCNLVGNAVKFTREGSVSVYLRYRDGRLNCEVIDTGIGMSPDVQDSLFRPFHQADASTARRFGGTGLGLAICKRLCEMMGGEISVSSLEGRGSTFRFTLPVEVVSPPQTHVSLDVAPLRPLEVLVAEDNRVNQLVVRRFLERLGVHAVFVDDGEEAVASVMKTTFDLVLMDRHMPKVDGLEATRRIRRLPGQRADTPVVALTASVMADDRQECLEAGMNAFLPKPVEPKMLEEALRTHARERAQGLRTADDVTGSL